MSAVGIRKLKNNLSEYIRQVEKGKKVAVTSHGRIVAELVPPGTAVGRKRTVPVSRFDRLVADGVIRPPLEEGDPLEDDGVRICLPKGTVQELTDWDRPEDDGA